jgi:hypothetical protein
MLNLAQPTAFVRVLEPVLERALERRVLSGEMQHCWRPGSADVASPIASALRP